jgi:predicted site-specific integrase-resolvase
MNTVEAAEKFNVSKYTVIKWCKKNKIKRKLGVNGIMEYNLSEKDITKFEKRETNPGRPKKVKK